MQCDVHECTARLLNRGRMPSIPRLARALEQPFTPSTTPSTETLGIYDIHSKVLGLLHESFAHFRYKWFKKRRFERRRPPFDNWPLTTRAPKQWRCGVQTAIEFKPLPGLLESAQLWPVLAKNDLPLSSNGRRRHAGGIASGLRKHPKHGSKC